MTTLAAALIEARNAVWNVTDDNSDRMEALRGALALSLLDTVGENPAYLSDADYLEGVHACARTLMGTANAMAFMAPRADLTVAVGNLAHLVGGLAHETMYHETPAEQRAAVAVDLAREVNPYRAALGATIAGLVR